MLAALPELALRVYAPVGEHRDLLAYLVRRLLENGANSSFVHQLANAAVPVDELLRSPLHALPGVGQPLPIDLYGPARRNPLGVDLAVAAQREPLSGAWAQCVVPAVRETQPPQVDATMQRLHRGWPAWNAMPVSERAALLRARGRPARGPPARLCGLARA